MLKYNKILLVILLILGIFPDFHNSKINAENQKNGLTFKENFEDPTMASEMAKLLGVNIDDTITQDMIDNTFDVMLKEKNITSIKGIEIFENIEFLSFTLNNITYIPDEIKNMKNLYTLQLSANQISNIPDSLGELTQLEDLQLANNHIKDIPNSIENLDNLYFLTLDNNLLTTLPTVLMNLDSLDSLYATHNMITEIPLEFNEMKNLFAISFTDNHIISAPENWIKKGVIPYGTGVILQRASKTSSDGSINEDYHLDSFPILNQINNAIPNALTYVLTDPSGLRIDISNDVTFSNEKLIIPSSYLSQLGAYNLEVTPIKGQTNLDDSIYNDYFSLKNQPIGEVIIKYVDTNNNQIAQEDIINGVIGTTYTTTQKIINDYELTSIPLNANGTFAQDSQEVIYEYKKIPVLGENITVKYVDELDVGLSEDIILSGYIDESYTTVAKEIPKYTLKTIPNNSTGTFTNMTQEVKYIYAKNPIIAKSVTIKYVDELNIQIKEQIELTGYIGDPYMSEALDISGYNLKFTPNNANGIFTNTPQEVKYIYQKNITKGEDVFIHYLFEDQPIADDIILTGNIGEQYTSNPLKIEGYTLSEIPNNATGFFQEIKQEVKYIYTKDIIKGQNVTVSYIDEFGIKIATDEILEGNIEEQYIATPKIINGYSLLIAPNNAIGTFKEVEQTVKYIYEKEIIKGQNVIISFVDKLGVSIEDPIILEGNIGDNYISTPKIIAGYTLINMPNNAAGKFTSEIQEVKYIYLKDQGNVIVKYVDTNNNKIANDILLSGPIETEYTTQQLDIEGYTIQIIPNNATGKYNEIEQTVIYIYNTINGAPSLGAPVITKYIDESNATIAEDEILYGEVNEPYETKSKEIVGYILKVIPENNNGIFTEAEQIVKYTYQKIINSENMGALIVRYTNNKNNDIIPPELISGNIGEEYIAIPKEIEDYTLKASRNINIIIFTKETQTINFTYIKNEPPISIRPENENDKDPEKLFDSGLTQNSYIGLLLLTLLTMGLIINLKKNFK